MEVPGRSMHGGVLESLLGRIGLVFPPSTVVQFHPIVLSILNFPSVLEGLGKKIPQVIVVRGVFETKIAHIAKVLGEFF